MLSLSEIITLKSELKEQFGTDLHFHDVCPKPYFTLDDTGEEIREFISDFLSTRRLKPGFSDDDLQFTVEKK